MNNIGSGRYIIADFPLFKTFLNVRRPGNVLFSSLYLGPSSLLNARSFIGTMKVFYGVFFFVISVHHGEYF